jgi:hypothetical protein
MNFMASRSQSGLGVCARISCAAMVMCFAVSAHAQTPASAPPVIASPVASNLPKITYVNGQLTINAQDATLGDILRAVSTKTGAVIEFPADRAQEHLFANAGPGSVREVLSSVLNGSHFNYVMLASPTNPNILQRMILTSAEEPVNPNVSAPPLQAAVQPAVVNAPQAQEIIQKGLTPEAAAESAAIEAMEAPKEPLSPDALEAMMKARREARKAQREQEAGSGSQSQ